MVPFGVSALFILEKIGKQQEKGLSLNAWVQHPHSLICFPSDSDGKLFCAICCHSTSQQLLKSMSGSLAFCHALVIADGFSKAAYAFQPVFPLGEEISRYKQDKQLKAPCVLQDRPCCFSILKRANPQESDTGDCHHFKSLHHRILKDTGWRKKKKSDKRWCQKSTGM